MEREPAGDPFTVLVVEYELLREDSRSAHATATGLLGVFAALIGILGVALAELHGSSKEIPAWLFAFFPLPIVAIGAVLTLVSNVVVVRDRYLREIEQRLHDLAGSPTTTSGLPYPGVHHLTRPVWTRRRGGALWFIAIGTLGAVVVTVTVICLVLTRSLWLGIGMGVAYFALWLVIAALWFEATWTDRVWNAAKASLQEISQHRAG